jgi:hypothetical protein
MKNVVLVCALALFLVCSTATVQAVVPVKVDVLYMNHGPLQDTLNKMKTIFSGYNTRLTVSWHDFESSDGEKFMASKGIKQHVPLAIWIDGKPTCTVGSKKVTFAGFPTGSGPAFFQGKWTMEDLKAALSQATDEK